MQREEPTLPVRVGRETEGNSTGENRGQAAHRQTGRKSPRWSQSAGCRSRGPPHAPGCASGSPQLSPQLRRTHARARRAHPPHTGARLRGSPPPPGSPPGRGAYVPSNTQITSRTTYGSRVLSNMVTGWTMSLPGAGGGWKRPRRSRYPIPRSPALGMAAAPSDRTPPRLKAAATWAVWTRPRRHQEQPCPRPSLHGPLTGPGLPASCRRSVASGACSQCRLAAALRCPVPSPTGGASRLQL